MTAKDAWAQAHQIAYDEGFRDALELADRIVRKKLGDRLVNNTWQPGSPLETEIVQELQQRRPR